VAPGQKLEEILEVHRSAESAVAVAVPGPKLDNEDAFLDVPEIVAKYGYPIEIHEVTTADGYILTVHHIPYGKKSGPAPNKPVVWLQHGLLCSSADWILNNEDKALAYMLADAGYDVWMGNARGNKYSKKHVSLTVKDKEFWQFSWHEMGVYDIPAVIDYTLAQTGQENLYYVGHSMGTTMFWIAMSERPEYNSKIRLMSALAPVSFVEHMISPIALLAPIANQLEDILNFLGAYEFLPSTALMEFLGATLCHQYSPIQAICSNVLFLVAGFNTDQLNTTMLPVILGHTPAGASAHTVVHYAQGVNSGLFRQFNHGKAKNLELYGRETPPEYDWTKITCPVALYWGENDWLGAKADTHRMAELVPTLVRKYRVNHNKYNHLDFLWAKDNDVLLNKPVMEFMKYF